ncbi:MAG: hypothetical protein ACK4GO_04235 [Gemmobacter sp.]
MTRGEAWVRLAFCGIGLGLIAAALMVHGLPEGPGLVEVVGVAGVFFGWSGLRAVQRLWRGP